MLLRRLAGRDITFGMTARVARVLAFMLCCAPAMGRAEAPAGDEMKEMRQMLEQQSRQLDVLAQEIARLNLLLEAKPPTAAGLAATPAEGAAGMPGAGKGADAAAEEAAIPKAAPVDGAGAVPPGAAAGGPVHIVTKGETLTAIAKRYKVTVPELLKVNKIADVRKLQIGQTLALPPGAKIPESTPTPTPQQ